MANNRNTNTSPAANNDVLAELKVKDEALAAMQAELDAVKAELEKKDAELEAASASAKTEMKPAPAKEVKKVSITIPITRTEKDDVYVAVNGRSFQIKRGEKVEVPEYVVEALQHEAKMLLSVAALEDAAAEKAEK